MHREKAHNRCIMDPDVFGILHKQVEETKCALEEAKQRFWELTRKPGELPAGSGNPDGSEQYRRVIAEERFTLSAHLDAVRRLNDYLLDGTVPDDLREKLKKTKTARSA